MLWSCYAQHSHAKSIISFASHLFFMHYIICVIAVCVLFLFFVSSMSYMGIILVATGVIAFIGGLIGLIMSLCGICGPSPVTPSAVRTWICYQNRPTSRCDRNSLFGCNAKRCAGDEWPIPTPCTTKECWIPQAEGCKADKANRSDETRSLLQTYTWQYD